MIKNKVNDKIVTYHYENDKIVTYHLLHGRHYCKLYIYMTHIVSDVYIYIYINAFDAYNSLSTRAHTHIHVYM